MQPTLIVLELHIFQRKLENSLKIKKYKNSSNIFRIQAYDSIMCGYFVLDLLVSQ